MKSQDVVVFLGALLVLGVISFGVVSTSTDTPATNVQTDVQNNAAVSSVGDPQPAEQISRKKNFKPAKNDTTRIITVENVPRNDGSAGNAAILAEDKLR